MSSRINWNRSPERGWGPWKGIGKVRIADPTKKVDRSPKTRRGSPGEKEQLITELEKRGER